MVMKVKTLKFGTGFKVLAGNRRAQAAQMVIAPDGSEGGPGNSHRGADQWLFVAAGVGVAKINGRRIALKKGSLLLIECGEEHEIRNTGRSPLKTLNIYLPPAYAKNGEPLRRPGQNRVWHGIGGPLGGPSRLVPPSPRT